MAAAVGACATSAREQAPPVHRSRGLRARAGEGAHARCWSSWSRCWCSASLVDDYLTRPLLQPRHRRASPSPRCSPPAQSLVIITRNIDLSVGSIVGRHAPTSPATCSATTRHCRRSWRCWPPSAIGAAARPDQRRARRLRAGARRSSSPSARWRSTARWLISHAESRRSRRLAARMAGRPAAPHGVRHRRVRVPHDVPWSRP